MEFFYFLYFKFIIHKFLLNLIDADFLQKIQKFTIQKFLLNHLFQYSLQLQILIYNTKFGGNIQDIGNKTKFTIQNVPIKYNNFRL